MFRKKTFSWEDLSKAYDENTFSYQKFFRKNNNLTRKLVDEIPDDKLLDVVWDYVNFNMDEDYGAKEEKSLMKIPEPFRMVYILRKLQGEVNNGGYDQYFFNSSGYYVFETIQYLKTIKAENTRKLTEKALGLVNKENLEKEEFKEQQINRQIDYDDVCDELDELDSKFYESKENLDEFMVKYLREKMRVSQS